MSNVLTVLGEEFTFDRDISKLQDKLDLIVVNSKLMGYRVNFFYRESCFILSEDYKDFYMYVLSKDGLKGFALSIVVNGGVVNKIGRSIGEDIAGSYFEARKIDKFLNELEEILSYI